MAKKLTSKSPRSRRPPMPQQSPMPRHLKLGFQGWYLTQPYTGIGQHCRGLLRALAARSVPSKKPTPELSPKPTLELFIPVPKRVNIKGIPPKWLHVIKPKWWLFHPGLKKWYWERAQAPAFFAKRNPDWEHYPYPCPLPNQSPNLRSVTVHDLIPWHDKRYRGSGLASRLKNHYHKLSRRSLVQVDHIFTVSQATHDELGIPSATLLSNAIADMPKAQQLAKLSYENTLVYFGGYDIRKNVPQLVQAFSALRKKMLNEKIAPNRSGQPTPPSQPGPQSPPMQLVLIGAPHHKSPYYPEVPEAEGVHKLGVLSDKELYSALKSAFAFVHFSDSEGFNIPLLQAMSVGTPAIVMDLPVNREVSAGSALFIPIAATGKSINQPSQASELFDKVKLLKNKQKRAQVIAAQKNAARRYSWEKSAKQFLKAFEHGR